MKTFSSLSFEKGMAEVGFGRWVNPMNQSRQKGLEKSEPRIEWEQRIRRRRQEREGNGTHTSWMILLSSSSSPMEWMNEMYIPFDLEINE